MDTASKIPPRDRTDNFFTYTQDAASNPSTAPDVLRKLAKSRDRITRAHVTANPNTPTYVLWKLGAEFPEQLINNPIFNLLFLENHQVITQIPHPTLITLLLCEQAPPAFLELVTDYLNSIDSPNLQWQCISALTINPNIPQKYLEPFINKFTCELNICGAEIAEVARLHINWAGEMTEGLDESLKTVLSQVDVNLNSWNFTIRDKPNIRQLSDRDNFNEFIELGLVPEFILSQLSSYWQDEQSKKMSPHLRKTIDTQKIPCSDRQQLESYFIISEDCLEQLIQQEEIKSDYLIVRIEEIPVKFLDKLAINEDAQVRMAVAQNQTTPDRIIKQLQQDPQECVRKMATLSLPAAIAANPNLPLEQLAKLAEDMSDRVRQNVARNPQTPLKLLEKLISDHDSTVRKVAVKHYLQKKPDGLPFVLRTYAQNVTELSLFFILLNPQMPVDVLVENSRALEWRIRFAIAYHPNTPKPIRQHLANDGNRIVRATAKAHLKLTDNG